MGNGFVIAGILVFMVWFLIAAPQAFFLFWAIVLILNVLS